MKRKQTVWKRTISSVAALAIALSLGGPMMTVYGEETAPLPSSDAVVQESWEETAAKAIGAASGRDAVEKIYNHLQTLEGHKDAASFQTLAGKYSLMAKTVSGTLSNAAHSWNLVQLEGAWYGVDVAKGVLLSGSKTLLADGTTAFGTAYKTADATALSEDSYKTAITITPAAASKVYGESDPAFSYTASDKNVTLEGSISRAAGDSVGEYAYTLGGLKIKDAAQAGRYKLVLAANAPKFKITARELKVSDIDLQSDSRVYDEASTAVPVQQVFLTGLVNGDVVSVDLSKIQASVSSAEAGVYSAIKISGLTLQGDKAGNYTIPASASVSKTFTIKEPEPPEVVNGEGEGSNAADTNQGKKDEAENANSSNSSNTDEAGKDDAAQSGEQAAPPDNTGSSEVPPSNPSNTDTQAPDQSQQPGTEVPPGGETSDPSSPSNPSEPTTPTTPEGKTVITVAILSQEKTFGDEFDPAPQYNLLIDGKELEATDAVKETYGITGEIGRAEGNNAGRYEYNQGTLATSNDKYELKLSEEKAFLDILPQKVSVLVPDQWKYVEAPDKTFEYMLGKDMPVTGAIERQPGEAVGTYSFSIGTLAPANEIDKKNYDFVLAADSGTFQIISQGSAPPAQKVQVLVTPNPSQKAFGAPDPEFTYTLSQAIAVTGKLGRVPGDNVGTYSYTLGDMKPASDLFELVLDKSQPEAVLTIVPKTVKVYLQSQTKVYGDPDPKNAYTLEEQIEVRGNVKREYGEDVQGGVGYRYTLGDMTAVSKNYTLEVVYNDAMLTITPRPVEIFFRRPAAHDVEFNTASGTAFVEYDGKAKEVVAYYPTARGEESKVSVLYNNSAEKPKELGAYSLSVTVDDPNYVLSGGELSIRQMMIRRKTFDAVDITRTVSRNDTARKSVPLSQFGVPTNTNQYIYVYNMEGDAIFQNIPTVENGNVYFQLLSGLTPGMKRDIILRVDDARAPYGFNEFRLTVIVGEEGYETFLQGTPSKVTLGKDIPLSSGFRLGTKNDNGTTTYEVVTKEMLSGYDKTATGSGSLGKKTVTVTSKKHSGSSSFVITVEDQAVGLEVGAPDQLDYDTSDTRLDLSGGWVALKMQSGVPQNRKSLTMSMLNVGNNILNKAGSYPVKVTYSGYSLLKAFTFTVERSSWSAVEGDMYPSRKPESDSGFGLTLSASDVNGYHDTRDVYLLVDSLDSDDYDTLEEYMDKRSVDDYELMDLSLYDAYYDEKVDIRSGKNVTIYIPYPDGTSPSRHTFTVYHLVNGRVRTEAVTTQSTHMKISVNSLSPFAVAWKRKSASSGSSGSSGGNLSDAVQHQREMEEFWDDVVDTLEDTRSGRTVMVDAGDYGSVPTRVLNAIKGRDVTLKIENDDTKTIVLNGQKLPKYSSSKTSYTMSELYKAVQDGSSSTSSNSGTSSGGSLEDLWGDVVKSLKSYQEGTTITINAKDNSTLPKTVLDAVRGRNVTMKLKSEDYPPITINGKEMPVDLGSKKSYTLKELYDASVPASVNELESLWSDVVENLKSYKSGAKVTVNAGNNTFIPDTLLDAIRGRNVTVELKSDYTSELITLNGSSLPKSLSGERYYTISQIANRAKSGGSIIQSPRPVTGIQSNSSSSAVLPQGGAQTGTSSSSQSQAVAPVSPSGSSSSSEGAQSSSQIVAPPSDAIIPPIHSGETVPSIENTEQGSDIMPKVIIGMMIFAILVVLGILVFLLSGKRPRQRTK